MASGGIHLHIISSYQFSMFNQILNSKIQKIFFITFGCRLNQAETASLKTKALESGLGLAKSETDADFILINSCSVTDKAQKEVNKLLKRLNNSHPKESIIITGCGAHDEHKKYAVVVKNKDKENLFSVLLQQSTKCCFKPASRHSEQSEESQRSFVVPPQDDEMCGRTRLMVKVQEGCNNFCSYCIVPYLRGRERSFAPEMIIKDLREAEKQGYKEVVLCGVNIGKYHCMSTPGVDINENSTLPVIPARQGSGKHPVGIQTIAHNRNLVWLIRHILENTSFPRIRISSINPDDFSDELIDLWAHPSVIPARQRSGKHPAGIQGARSRSRLCPHFHISLQSGSDSVLKRMGRKYDTEQYASLIAKLRRKIPEVQITTDIIVGFPGETDEEFAETLKFVKKMKFLKVHVFRYSPREGTRAAKMPDQVSEKIKKERAVKLQKLESEIRQEILKGYIGKEVEVLFESIPLSSSRRRGSIYSGYTSNYIKVFKKSATDLTNQIQTAQIGDASKNELLAN